MSAVDWLNNALYRLVNAVRPSFLEIIDEGPNRLVLESNRGTFVFDARRRVVSRNGKPVTSFDRIKFVDLTREKESLEHTEWRIDLYLSFLHRIRIGESRDDVLVSIIGARIVTLTGAKPLAWKESHDVTR